jgi:hypothetical protein
VYIRDRFAANLGMLAPVFRPGTAGAVVDDVLLGGEHRCGSDDEGECQDVHRDHRERVASLSAPIV